MIILIAIVDFLITSALSFGISWALDLPFTAKIAFGVWLTMLLIRYLEATSNIEMVEDEDD